MRKTGHWERFDEDLASIASFGIRYLRYGVPFHVVAKNDDPRSFDWQWIDRSMGALQAHGIEPILNLLHFGLPDDIRAVGDPRLPGRYQAYAAAVAERYPWVRYYTPVNEPFVTAWLSAKEGLWNERRRDDGAFVAALDNVVTCVILGMRRISERRPDAIFIQSDACDSYRALDPAAAEQASFLTERRYVAYDLTLGRRPSQLILHWLRDNGMCDQRLAWFAEHGTSERFIIGHDYYRGNERLIDDRGRVRRAGPLRRGFQALALDFHARYDLPFMLCETNIAGTHAPGWLAEVWNDALDLKDRGLPIRGFCWYGFVDHVDWDTLLTRNRGKVNTCGLVGQDRRPHAVGQPYRQLATAALDGRYPRLERSRPSGAVSLVQ